MDKNGKLFGKISIIDLIVALLIILVAVGTVYRFASPNTAVDRGDARIYFTLRIDGVRDFTAVNYQEGLRVYDRHAGQFIGNINSVRTEPNYQLVALTDGSLIRTIRPGHATIYIEIAANGRLAPNAIYVEGTNEITTGSVMQIATKYVQVLSVVEDIRVVEQ